MSKRLIGNMMLLFAAMIWVAAFVAQSVGMEYVGPLTFQAIRCILGALVLLPVMFVTDRMNGGKTKPCTSEEKKTLLKAGLFCGIALFFACYLQQVGLVTISAGKSGFITSFYIVLVPVLSIFLHQKVGANIWVSVVFAILGLWLLCAKENLSIGLEELLTLICAFAFSIQILLIDHYCDMVDGVRLSFLQFLVCGVISLIGMFLFERPSLSSILQCWLPIGYAGICSCAGGYTLQILGQARTTPTVASLLMSLESVFALIFGWILLRQALSTIELLGCTLVFSAVVLSQIPVKKNHAKTSLTQ